MRIKLFENFEDPDYFEPGVKIHTWELDDHPQTLEDEQWDAQGEMQQFLSGDDDATDLFGEQPTILPFALLTESVKGAMYQVSRQGEQARETVESLKEAMQDGEPIPPITVWKNANGTYKIISGRHRTTAAIELGYTHAHCFIMYWRSLAGQKGL